MNKIKFKLSILGLICTSIYSQEKSPKEQLVDIKPVYIEFNYFFIMIFFILLTALLVITFKIIKNKYGRRPKPIIKLNWRELLTAIEDDRYLSPKDAESEFIKVFKLFLEDFYKETFTSQSDQEVITILTTKLKNNQRLHKKIQKYFKHSEEYRFNNGLSSAGDFSSQARSEATKELILEIKSFDGDSI